MACVLIAVTEIKQIVDKEEEAVRVAEEIEHSSGTDSSDEHRQRKAASSLEMLNRKLKRQQEQHEIDRVKLLSLEQENELLRLKYCTLEQQHALLTAAQRQHTLTLETLTATQQENKELTAKVQSLEALLKSSKESKRDSKSALVDTIQHLERELTETKRQLQFEQQKVAELEATNQQLWHSIEELPTQCDMNMAAVADMTASQLSQQLSALQQNYEQQQNSHRHHLEQHLVKTFIALSKLRSHVNSSQST
jgi:hypothetical protein